MFEVELSRIDTFRNLVKALSVIVDEGTFNIDEAQMKLLAMDPSHVAMVDFELPSEFFDKYTCDGENRLTLNIGEFLKFIDRVDKDENVKIRLDEENARLTIHCKRGGHTRRFAMPILEPLDDEVPQPKIFFKASSRILTQSLRRAIRDSTLVSEHVKVEVAGDGGGRERHVHVELPPGHRQRRHGLERGRHPGTLHGHAHQDELRAPPGPPDILSGALHRRLIPLRASGIFRGIC
jgi:hypothetical protein